MRWLCRKFKISTNGYYNYLKHRKYAYYEKKAEVQRFISQSFHQNNGTMGSKMMTYYCCNSGYKYSHSTISKYMKELHLSSSTRCRKPSYSAGKQNCVFPNLIQQKFVASKPNQVWCLDFTYLYLANGTPRYNCTIIDVYERRVVSSVNGSHINSQLAINTVSKGIQKHYPEKGLILHSHQRSQFTSKAFNHFCEQRHIQQSMSRSGCPYDSAVMEQYFNTLKHECTNHYEFRTKEKMDEIINCFEENWYNTERPHTYNNGLAPNQFYSNSTLL